VSRMPRRGREPEVEGLDEEFLFHLNRGSELMGRGEAEAARAALERALELRPKDAKVLGLLGQSYYKLARFPEAVAAWQRLVDDNPVEPGARVNLGLANLKAKRHAEAVKQLEIALDLSPDHRKAMGYLGLALLESGDASRARDWFRKAGSDGMVARCEEILAGGAIRSSAGPSPEPVGGESHPSPEPMPAPGAAPAIRAASTTQPALAAWAATRVVRAASGETFVVGPDALTVAVRGEVLVRLDGLFASRGRITLRPELKRFRGRETDRPFGDGPSRMVRVIGEGVLLFRAAGRRFTALDLGTDAGYFREEVVFGFEEPVAFENGRVPSRLSADLNLVHLRGRGRMLLLTADEPVAVDVTPDAPLRLPLSALVGWIGALTPRVTTLAGDDEDMGGEAAVELTGEGRVLADPAAAPGAALPR
jgi:Tetratricopeptide repeat